MITALQIRQAKAKDKAYKLTDANGLYLLVKPNGGKYWRYKYRFNGKENTYAIGTFNDFSLQQAREIHKNARQLLKEGIDPNRQKQTERIQRKVAADNSFQHIAKKWHDSKKLSWDEKHAQKIWRSFELHVFPFIGKLAIRDIEPHAVLDIIRRLEKDGSTDLSYRVLQRCNGVFNFAKCASLLQHNPAEGLKGALVTHKTQHFPSISIDELLRFLQRLEAVNTSCLNKLAIKLLMHTFVRQMEQRRAKWQEFDLEGSLWTVPAEHTKLKRQHLVPLSRQAVGIMQELYDITGNGEYVFPSQSRQKNPL